MPSSSFSFDINAENFDQVVMGNSHKVPVLVDIWAPWCEPCKILKPLLENLAEEYQGKFILAKLNSEDNQEIAQQLGVRNIPTVKAIFQGKLINEFSGALPETELRKFINGLFPSPAEILRSQAGQLAQQAEFDQALGVIEEALVLEPENTKLKIDQAALLIALERVEEAKVALDSLPSADKDADHVKEMFTRISIKQKTEGMADATTLLAQIESEPENLQARLDLATLYSANQQYPDAIAQCFEIIKADRNFGDDIGRKTLLDIFTLLGNSHDLVRTARRQLSALLN